MGSLLPWWSLIQDFTVLLFKLYTLSSKDLSVFSSSPLRVNLEQIKKENLPVVTGNYVVFCLLWLEMTCFCIVQEYELQESDESKFVKDLDRLDMVIQAYEYEQQEHRPGFLQEFFDSTEGDKMRENESEGEKERERWQRDRDKGKERVTASPMGWVGMGGGGSE